MTAYQCSATHGYLHDWVQKNYKRVWRKEALAPRFMGKNALANAQQTHFYEFGKMLVSRLGDTFPEGKKFPIEFNILDIEYEGAWVAWPAQCYGIFITKALVWKIQKICFHAPNAMQEGKEVQVELNFFRQLWDNLPDDEEHYHHFGTLIAHIAFSFIVHHELAHAGLGHEGIRISRGLSPVSSQSEENTGAEFDYLDELAVASNFSVQAKDFAKSQALETDADVHGMFYTRRLLIDETKMLQEVKSINDDIQAVVWKTLLRDTKNLQLMLFIGVAVGLLSLLPDLEAEKFGGTNPTTHPPTPSRLLLMFHAIRCINVDDPHFAENQSAAISAAIILFDAFFQENGNVKCADMQGFRNHEPSKDEGGAAHKPNWESLSHISIVDTLRRQKEVGSYWEELVSEIRSLSSSLDYYARFPDFMRYKWYTPATRRAK